MLMGRHALLACSSRGLSLSKSRLGYHANRHVLLHLARFIYNLFAIFVDSQGQILLMEFVFRCTGDTSEFGIGKQYYYFNCKSFIVHAFFIMHLLDSRRYMIRYIFQKIHLPDDTSSRMWKMFAPLP